MEHDVAAIERATLAAMPPQAVAQVRDWLVPLDGGTVGRAHSAVPLHHGPPPPDILETLGEVFAQHGLPVVLRLPQVAAFDALQAQLEAEGCVSSKPTLVQVGTTEAMAALPAPAAVQLADAPGAAWSQVFLGPGFDPADGASRLAILRRARQSVFASVHEGGELVAVGSACFAEGWCGVHGMRTLPAYRGRSLAAAILAALAAAARRRGMARAFLQVEAGNAPAQALYRRAGFATAWRYAYWRRG